MNAKFKHRPHLNGRMAKRPDHTANPEWENLREQVFAEQGGECATCPAPTTDLHHRHYDNAGQENRADVVGLCFNCHEAVTSSIRSRRFANGDGELIVELGRVKVETRSTPGQCKTMLIESSPVGISERSTQNQGTIEFALTAILNPSTTSKE